MKPWVDPCESPLAPLAPREPARLKKTLSSEEVNQISTQHERFPRTTPSKLPLTLAERVKLEVRQQVVMLWTQHTHTHTVEVLMLHYRLHCVSLCVCVCCYNVVTQRPQHPQSQFHADVSEWPTSTNQTRLVCFCRIIIAIFYSCQRVGWVIKWKLSVFMADMRMNWGVLLCSGSPADITVINLTQFNNNILQKQTLRLSLHDQDLYCR